MRKLILWLTLTGITLSTATEWRPTTFNITYSDLLLIIGSLMALFLRWNGTSILGDVRVLAFFGCGVVLFYFGFLISFTQGDPLRFLLVAAQYAFCFFLLPYIFSRSAQCSPKAFERGARYFLFFLALTSFGGFVGYFLFNDAMRSLDLVALNDRYQGLVANPNRFSSLITLSLPLLFGLRSAQCISSPVLLVVLVSFMAGLTVASSIGGLLSAAVTLAVMGAINFRPTVALKGMLVVTLLGIVLISSFGVPKVLEQRVLSKFNSNQSVDVSVLGSFDTRMAIADEAMRRIVNSPFIGDGLDNYLERSSFGHTVHNTMLLVWAEGGGHSAAGIDCDWPDATHGLHDGQRRQGHSVRPVGSIRLHRGAVHDDAGVCPPLLESLVHTVFSDYLADSPHQRPDCSTAGIGFIQTFNCVSCLL